MWTATYWRFSTSTLDWMAELLGPAIIPLSLLRLTGLTAPAYSDGFQVPALEPRRFGLRVQNERARDAAEPLEFASPDSSGALARRQEVGGLAKRRSRYESCIVMVTPTPITQRVLGHAVTAAAATDLNSRRPRS